MVVNGNVGFFFVQFQESEKFNMFFCAPIHIIPKILKCILTLRRELCVRISLIQIIPNKFRLAVSFFLIISSTLSLPFNNEDARYDKKM